MSITYTKTFDDYFVEIIGEYGSIAATLHRLADTSWRLCIATCTGSAFQLQGTVVDAPFQSYLRSELHRWERELSYAEFCN